MILAAFFILGIGLCAAENQHKLEETNPSTTYKNTLTAVQKTENLHLLWYSLDLSRWLEECLISKFLNKTDHGAKRTLETNAMVTEILPGSPLQQSKANVTVHVHERNPYPYITLHVDGGEIESLWTEQRDLLFATPNCFVLQALIKEKRKLSCVVWGLGNSGKKCLEYAKRNCESGEKVDLKKCEDHPKKGNKRQA
uniref:Putative secreted protein 94 n=1 Tax=Amblyomma cajennense TaxID=34607 RepID=A0A023FG70_AMBCJ